MGKRILIVEDESIIALSIKVKLEELGHEVVDICESGEEVVEIINSNDIDLIFMDIRLSGEIDGIDTAIKIRKEFDIPSIFLTAYVDDETTERAKEAYPIGYLQKPFKDNDIKTTIEIGLYKEEMHRKVIEQEKKLEEAHRIAKIVHWDINLSKNTGNISDNAERILGRPQQYFKEQHFKKLVQLIHPKDRDSFLQEFNKGLFQEDEFRSEFRINHPDGEIKYIVLIGEIVERVEGDPKLVRGIFQDITDRKNLEQKLRIKENQLQKSQKLEAICQFSGQIAKDFNNYLTVINGNIELLKTAKKQKIGTSDKFDTIFRAIEKANNLIEKLMDISQQNIMPKENLHLNNEIEDIKELIQILTRDYVLDIDLTANHDYINGNSSQIQQIILNLISNSIESLSSDGEIHVKTENEILEQTEGKLQAGEYVVLSIYDNGFPLNKEVIENIDNPYLSPDLNGNQPKIELSTVYNIVKNHNGELIIDQENNPTGTTMKIYFPIGNPPESTTGKTITKSGEVVSTGKPTILVVEPNFEIQKLLKSLLSQYNEYNIKFISSGQKAINYYYENQSNINLLIFDVSLISDNGVSLLNRIKQTNSDQQILVMSGFVKSLKIDSYLDKTVKYISKPFTIKEFNTKIENMIIK